MGYSEDLDLVVTTALKDLIKDYSNNVIMFNKEKNLEYLDEYINLRNENKNSNF